MLPYPEIDPVAFSIGPLTIAGKTLGPLEVHWYGLMYLFGLAGGWLVALPRLRRPGNVVNTKQVDDLVFYLAMGLIIGARAGYVFFYNFELFAADPMYLFRLWEGGMSFHGGMLGGAVSLAIYSRKIKQHPVDVLDFTAVYIPIGLFCGRMGNFIGSELYGRATDVPWAMVFPSDPEQLPRHPSQLYEAFLEGIVLLGILYWFSNKPRPRGAVAALAILGYGIFRFSVEFVREPDSHIGFDAFNWMTRGQILCIPMIAFGLFVLTWTYYKQYQKSAGLQATDGGLQDDTPIEYEPSETVAAPSKKSKNKKKKKGKR